MMTGVKVDHVRIGNLPNGGYRMFCLHCGEHYTPALPINLNMFLAMSKVFGGQHKTCKPGERAYTEGEIMGRFDRGVL